MADRGVHELARALYTGRVDRREFIRRAAALGVSSTAIGLFLRGAEVAQAQDASPAAGGGLKPPVVAKPCGADCLWAGKQITVQVIDASVKEPLDEVRQEFEAATGAKLTVVADPIEGAFTKLIDDQTSGTNAYNGSEIAMQWLGELVEGDFVVPLDEFYNDTSGKFPDIKETVDQEPASMKQLRSYGDKLYVVPNDLDGQVLYYRRDLLTDEKHQKAFQDATGYAMPVPPQTWEQLRDIAKYFNGKDNGLGGKVSGVSLHLKVGGQGMYHYGSLSAPYVIGPENPKLYWFDPDTMDPLCQSTGHIRAANLLKEIFGLGPEAMASWALGEAWDYFLKGNAVFTYSWGDVTPLAIEQKQPTVGKIGASQLPGTLVYVNPKTKQEYKVDKPNIVGNTTGGSWSGVVMKSAPDPDLVYYFWALLSTPAKESFYGARGSDGVDPGRKYQLLPPYGTAKVEDYTAQGWDVKDATEYCKAFSDNYNNPLILPYLRIPGSEQYWSAMDIRLSEFMTNQVPDADTALKNMADDWKGITEQLGAEQQMASYKKSLGL